MQETLITRRKNGLTSVKLFITIIFCLSLLCVYLLNALSHQDKIIKELNPIEPETITVYLDKEESEIQETPKRVYIFNEEIDGYVSDICKFYKIDEELVHSIIWHESRYNPSAVRGNCVGLMQVSTKWHSDRAVRLGIVDFYDPYSNILLGVDYLNELYTNNKSTTLVLMLYNMEHKTARAMYSRGITSDYARSVIDRAMMLKREVR